MILVSQSYISRFESRNEELRRCRRRNERNGLFDRVEYLDGGSRVLSFSELLEHCGSKHRGQWCVIANSDIAFGESSYLLRALKSEKRFVSLTRWDDHSGPRFEGHSKNGRFYSGSQDSWAFVAGGVQLPSTDIPLAVVGCDQVIAGWACMNGLEVVNPCLSIKTMHLHEVDDRPADRPAMRGFYAYPQMTTMSLVGEAACHDWPRADGEWEFEWRLYRYAK